MTLYDGTRPYPLLSRLLSPRGNGNAHALTRATRGKVILLTGASFGIGRALALRLGQAGAQLILAARSLEQLESVVDEIKAAGGQARAQALDLTDPAGIDAFCAQLASEGTVVDIVIHNAGKSIRRLVTQSLDRAHDYRRTMGVNYLGPVQLQLALLPAMIARQNGHIINISSLGVLLPPAPRWSAYSASKTAFDTWIRSAEPELGLYKIDCTSIYFGLVHTRMSAPTDAYRTMPGMTADEAAQVICRAIIQRPRTITPWWIAPLRVLAPWCDGVLNAVWRWLLRHDKNIERAGKASR